MEMVADASAFLSVVADEDSRNWVIESQSSRPRRSPFDVPGLNKGVAGQEILETIRETRRHSFPDGGK